MAARDRVISSMGETFSDAFFLWDNHPKDEGPARRHLVELLKNATDVAAMLSHKLPLLSFVGRLWHRMIVEDVRLL